MKVKLLSCVRPFATLWTVAHQVPPSMGFSRQEYWSELPFPSLEDLPNPGIEPESPALQADALTSEPPGKPSHRLRNPKFGALDLVMHILTHQVIDMPTKLKSHSTTNTNWVKPNSIPLVNGVLVNQLTVCVLVTQSCTTLCIPMDCSPPGSSVHGIPLARILEWVAISLSNEEY